MASEQQVGRGRWVYRLILNGLCFAALSVGMISCATVSVRKLDSNGQPTGPDGIRFYRPRPYVAVHEPFPIQAKAYIVPGQLTPDGKYVLVTQVPPELSTKQFIPFPEKGLESNTVPLIVEERGMAGGPQAKPGETKEEPQPPAATQPAAGADKPAKQGQSQITMKNDNSAFAVHPMRRYFDVTYLPDFEEEYVIEVKPRFGNAMAAITLGQGWSLQGLDAKTDNDAIVGPLLTLYSDTIKILSTLARASLGAPQGLVSAQVAPDRKGPVTSELKGGTRVSLRVTVVRMVSPGLYPILKPKELKAFDDMLEAKRTKLEQTMVLPAAPGTHVAFNTFEAIIVEAIPATGDSPYRITQYGGGTVPPLGAVTSNPDAQPRDTAKGAVQPAEVQQAVMDYAKSKQIPLQKVTVTTRTDQKRQVYQLEFTPTTLTPEQKQELVGAARDYLAQRGSDLAEEKK